MDKIAFPKTKRVLSCADLGMKQEDYADIKFTFWADPAQDTLFDIMAIVFGAPDLDNMTEEQKNELNYKFFNAVSELIIDSNISGISFDTAESCDKAFTSRLLSWGFMFEVVTLYIGRLLGEHKRLKKTLRRLSKISNSGKEEEKKENQ